MKRIFITLFTIISLTCICAESQTHGIVSLTQTEEQTRQYINWLLTAIFTSFFFSRLVKKHKTEWKLVAFVLIPVWLIMTFIIGVEDFYVLGTNAFSSFDRFTNFLAFNLAMVLFIGGITFYVKYRKFKKVTEKQSDNDDTDKS